MDENTALTFIYPKLCAKYALCFVKDRANKLFAIHSAQALWTEIFRTEPPVLPESMLCRQIEVTAKENFLKDFKRLLDYFDNPPMFFNVILSAPKLEDDQEINQKQDFEYAKRLFLGVQELQPTQKKPILEYLKLEYTLRNILWTLRLKVYYNMAGGGIKPLLIPQQRQEALKILDYPIDDFSFWQNWKYVNFLPPQEEGSPWSVDPLYFFHEAKKILYKKALSLFHKYPQSYVALFAWFKIKHYELDYIRTATESIRLNIDTKRPS